MEMNTIYLDHAATTAMEPEAVDAMLPYFRQYYGNPSAAYRMATESKRVLRKARQTIADTLQILPEEVFFTSGGTESDNWAVLGTARHFEKGHIITSRMEHPAVLEACRYLEQKGFEVTYVDVTKEGFVDLEQLSRSFRRDTFLVSIMYANNEVGTIQPIREIAEMTRQRGILFHTDGVQAYGQIPVTAGDGFDLFSASAHKFGGPKGVGFLVIRKSCQTQPWVYGGGQEKGLRSGTENVPGIAGMAKAAELAEKTISDRMEKVTAMRERLITGMCTQIPGVICNGDREKRLPGNAHFSFPGNVEAEAMLIWLDQHGVQASGGSACANVKGRTSHVLTAMGLAERQIRSAIRMTIGADNTPQEMGQVIQLCADFYGSGRM